jgi:5-methylthioadenosine/S-adenosylhomocysteine deaminase
VFSATGHDVTNVWVAGHHLVEDGRLRSVDVDAVIDKAQAAAEELFERRRRLRQSGPA